MTEFILNRVATDGNTRQAFERMKFETAKFLYFRNNDHKYDPNLPGAPEDLASYEKEAEAYVVRDIIGTYLEPQIDYQLIREFHGPHALCADKEIYKALDYSADPNTSRRLELFDTHYYDYKEQIRNPVRHNSLQNPQKPQKPQNLQIH